MPRKTLTLEVRRQLQAVAKPVLKDKGTLLFQAGQPSRGAFLIRGGQVKLSLDAVSGLYPARTVGSGMVVGLPATLSGEPYSLTAEAKTKCRLDFISRERLQNLLQRNSPAGSEIIHLLSQEISLMRKAIRRKRVKPGLS